MKKFYKTIFIAGLILISTFELQAQTTDNNLNQVDLMKKFVGRWKCELGNDTILISENIEFGTGLVCNSQVIANDKIINSVKQLYGYDKKTDKFIVAELIESSPVIEICSTWFTSATTGELVITNPDNAPFRFKFEFKTPDSIEQTAIQNNTDKNFIDAIIIKSPYDRNRNITKEASLFDTVYLADTRINQYAKEDTIFVYVLRNAKVNISEVIKEEKKQQKNR
ncbi:MAG: hypothetical protein LBP67_04180 [Bacteroidales bacterium]|jgi:hypothetical protein|nr:hypothetical protein [Bacteroidales bacterium]